ncbi:MAG: TolC family protein [Bacteroidales bacterium]|nr:TolC family protein [Bacteroidales bacterium]
MKLTILSALLATLLIVNLPEIVSAQDSRPATVMLSLQQAQDYAIKNNTQIKNSKLDLDIAKKKIKEITSIGLPQVNAQANYTHLFKVPELSFGGTTFLKTDLPSGTPLTSDDIVNEHVSLGYKPLDPIQLGVADNLTLDITVSQLIFSGEYIVGLQASRVFYQISEQGKQLTELNLKESVSNTYNLVLVLTQTHEILSKSYNNLMATLSEMRAMNEQGFIENTDVDQIELTSLNLENGLNSLQRQMEASGLLLKFQIGMPFDQELKLTDSLEATTAGISLDLLTNEKLNLSKNITYQILTTQESLAQLSLKREKSTYLPSLAAFYRHQEKVNAPAFDFNPKDVFGVTMNIPIFSSGTRSTKVSQRKFELEKATNTKNDVANGLELEFINSQNELKSAYEKFLNDKKNIDLTQRIYDKTLIKFKEGMSSSLDLTNVQNQYLTAQSNYFTAVYTLITAKNKLDKLTNKQ